MTPKPGAAPTRPPVIHRAKVAIVGLTFVYTCVLLWLWDAIAAGPDRNWWLNASLYLPQFLWALPGLALFVAALFVKNKGKRSWQFLLTPIVPLAIVLGPIMGLRGFPSPAQPAIREASKPLKVMTYNIGGEKDLPGLLRVIQQERPDVLLVQELGGQLESTLHAGFPDWNLKSNGEFLIATPLPIAKFERVELPQLADDPWKHPAYVRLEAQVDGTAVAIYDTHLSTPRPALAAMKERKSGASADLESNSITRLNQGNELAEALKKEALPYILGGDFNAPEASIACQVLLRRGARNAFSEAGKGYGYTSGHALRFGMSFVRIDHIFVSKHWAVEECHAGDKSASDHRPMIATVQLATPK